MADAKRREIGRGERVLPGLWRLRLPLPWPGVPHCNAWAIAAGDGIVLVDCGIHLPGSFAQLERAMAQVGLATGLVRSLVITHAHIDHWGAAATVLDRSGATLWMHPNSEHGRAGVADPAASLQRRLEIARQSGIPEPAMAEYSERMRDLPSGIAALVEPDALLVDGVRVDTDLGQWQVIETPGHAPSHVCLFQPERRLLISGDHLLGRISQYYDYGWTPDPVGEFLTSLDRIEPLDARLCLSGHGRTFIDIGAHIAGNRELIRARLAAATAAAAHGPITAIDAVQPIFDEPVTELNASWRLSETLCYLTHLERTGRLTYDDDAGVRRWRLTAGGDAGQP